MIIVFSFFSEIGSSYIMQAVLKLTMYRSLVLNSTFCISFLSDGLKACVSILCAVWAMLKLPRLSVCPVLFCQGFLFR